MGVLVSLARNYATTPTLLMVGFSRPSLDHVVPDDWMAHLDSKMHLSVIRALVFFFSSESGWA
jgi:hypothetical protein